MKHFLSTDLSKTGMDPLAGLAFYSAFSHPKIARQQPRQKIDGDTSVKRSG